MRVQPAELGLGTTGSGDTSALEGLVAALEVRIVPAHPVRLLNSFRPSHLPLALRDIIQLHSNEESQPSSHPPRHPRRLFTT
jgi:hypothetical protein